MYLVRMKMEITAEYIEEPNLIFGGHKEEKDPRLGLDYHGPFTYSDEYEPLSIIKTGIVGDASCISKCEKILGLISKEIPSFEPNKWLYPSFPGMSKNTNFQCEIKAYDQWKEIITSYEKNALIKVVNVNERISEASDLFVSKVKTITQEDNYPAVIICCLPHEIEQYCGISEYTRGAKTVKPTEIERKVAEFEKKNQKFLSDFGVEVKSISPKRKAFDLRNSLKGKIMQLNPAVPIQILKESTMNAILDYDCNGKNLRQEPASFAWNFATALYYKSNGKPWRLAKLRQDTCYIGISFYQDKNSYNKDMQTSMAQVFTHNGEGLVLRGEEVYVNEFTKEPHLSESQSKELVSKALIEYQNKSKRPPVRVVIHKETLFNQSEENGCKDAIGNISTDLVTINKRKNIKILRAGSYPVLRGTLIHLNQHEHLLYTSGYTPRIRTYPGSSIPQPLFITHYGDSNIQEICKEIIGLTKLNWNTTSFSTSHPITLEFSSKVGKILSELPKDQTSQNHYRFYM